MRVTITVTFFVWILLLTAHGAFSHFSSMDSCGNSCSAAAQSRECMCSTFHFGVMLIKPWGLLNSTTGEVYGPTVDLLKRVCEIAGRSCSFIGIVTDCWDGQFSKVLNERFADACVGLVKTGLRVAKYGFVEHGISNVGKPAIYARSDSNITAETLMSSHDFNLGFFAIQSRVFDIMLDTFLDQGFFVKQQNIIRMEGDLDTAISQLSSQLECGATAQSIDFVLVPPAIFPPNNFTFIADIDLDFGDVTIMVRLEDQCFLKWYDEAYEELICSDEYPAFCQELTASAGHITDFCRDRDSICS